MVDYSRNSYASTVTLDAPGTLGDTYGCNKFFSSPVSFMSGGGGGGIGLTLWDLGIFVGEPEELGRFALDRALAARNCAPASFPSGWVASTCIWCPLVGGGCVGLCSAFG